MATAYHATEVQGRGRRFWFRRAAARDAFLRAKRRAGYLAFAEGLTVWASFAKRRDRELRAVRAGVDPMAAGRYY